MDLRTLRCFLHIIDGGSFRAAAAALHLTQPALTQRIQRLEDTLGFTLFDRSKQRAVLTGKGKQFLPYARALVAEVETTQEAALRIRAGTEGELRIGFTVLGSFGQVPKLLRRVKARYPAISLTLQEAASHELERAVTDGRLDAAFAHPPLQQQQLRAIAMTHDPYIAALPLSVRTADERSITLGEIARIGLVMVRREIGPAIFDKTIAAFHAKGITPTIWQTANTSTALLGLVAAGMGAALIAGSLASTRLDGVRFSRLADEELSLPTALVFNPDNDSGALQQLIDLVKQDS